VRALSRGIRVEPNPFQRTVNIIGGSKRNRVATGVYGATIAGGGQSIDSAVCCENIVEGSFSTICGGIANFASGWFATVAGGRDNAALGDYSFAAGYRARADHDNSFVWSSRYPGTHSERDGQFRVNAYGGVRFDVNDNAYVDILFRRGNVFVPDKVITTSTGAFLSAGGVWTNASDARAKEGYKEVDRDDLLRRLAAMPISTWYYKAEGPRIRRIGPTAQDFHAAFGLGDGTSIATVDADGVALAAIQGLYERMRNAEAKVRKLRVEYERRLAEKQETIDRLDRRLTRLERVLDRIMGKKSGER
ncbi:MAG: hypothetical protein D6788_06220, partial [Planctomycetota bacterium]